MPRHSSTYIGIAFYTSKEYPMQWVIVLSSRQQFDGTVWCGTLIDSVNGRVESWRSCEHSPATFAPHLSFLGIVMVGKVDRPASDIQGSIFNKVWKEQDSRRGKDQYPPTDEYVCWALASLQRKNYHPPTFGDEQLFRPFCRTPLQTAGEVQIQGHPVPYHSHRRRGRCCWSYAGLIRPPRSFSSHTFLIHNVIDVHTPYRIVYHCLPIQCRRFITLLWQVW
jgi:hypothetical protein